MADLQFDNAPSLGKIDSGSNGVDYIWDGVKWSQQGGSVGGGPDTEIGPNPPGSPSVGDQWFNTVNGILFTWYQDEDGDQQWVSTLGGKTE